MKIILTIDPDEPQDPLVGSVADVADVARRHPEDVTLRIRGDFLYVSKVEVQE